MTVAEVLQGRDAKSKAIRLALEQLERDGRLTPERVIEVARPRTSPLHEFFEWDDSEAAKQWRLEQARRMIRGVEVVIMVDKRELSTVRYVRDPLAPKDEQGYVSVPQLQNEPTTARAMIQTECARAESALRRAESLAEVLGLRRHVIHVRRRVEALRARVGK